MGRRQKSRLNAIEIDLPFIAAFLDARQILDGEKSLLLRILRIAADPLHAMAREELQPLIGSWTALASELHHGPFGGRRVQRRRRAGSQLRRSGSDSGGKKLSTIHRFSPVSDLILYHVALP